jgi:hypothetical protein
MDTQASTCDRVACLKGVILMDYELRRRLLKNAEEYIRPYLPESVLLTDDGVLSYDYYSPIMYLDAGFITKRDLYDILREFIQYSLKGWTTYSTLFKEKLVHLVDESKEPRDYLIVLNIIFDLIRHGCFVKSQIVDILKDTTNMRALLELIKWDDYSVFEERKERFEL